MTILDQMQHFARQFGRETVVDGRGWRYYRLGTGTPVVWLTGGLRRAALGYGFLERLAANHTVLSPDYQPVQTIDEFFAAFDSMLQVEGIDALALGGQSYGGLLAQAYVAHRPHAVRRLILSSSGPADYGRAWLPVEYAFIALARVLPENAIKNLLAGGLRKFITVPEADRAEWLHAIDDVTKNELSRADVISHFAVAADLIRRGIVAPDAYRGWTGRIVVLSAENDPTQSKKDIPRYEKLFGRAVEVISLGNMGHTGALLDPAKFIELLEQALL